MIIPFELTIQCSSRSALVAYFRVEKSTTMIRDASQYCCFTTAWEWMPFFVWFGFVLFSFVSFLSGLYSSSGIYSRSIFKIKSLFNYIYSLFGYLRLLSNAHDFNDSNRHRPSRILYCMMYGVVQKEPPSTVYDGSSFPWNYLVVREQIMLLLASSQLRQSLFFTSKSWFACVIFFFFFFSL